MQGEKIRLRAMEPEDIDALYDMENDLRHWDVSDTQMPFSRYTMEQYVLSCANQDIYTLKQVRLMICENGSGTAVGCIDLYDYQPQHQRAAVRRSPTAGLCLRGVGAALQIRPRNTAPAPAVLPCFRIKHTEPASV